MTMRELCEDVAGGLRDGRAIKALQIGGPLGGILPALQARHRRSTSTPLAGRGLHGRPRRDRRLRRAAPTCARSPGTCCTSAPPRAAASASRAGSGSRARTTMFADRRSRSTARGSRQLLEALELGSLCAHGGGMPAPIRSLLDALPRGAGARMITLDDRRRGGRGPGRARPCSRPRAPRAVSPDALLRRAPGARSAPAASASSASRARPGPVAVLHDARARGHGGPHRGPDAPAASRPRSSSSCSPSCPAAARRAHRARRRSPRMLDVGEPRWPGERAPGRARRAPPVPGLPARAVHLLRALRARVRRGPGHVRADRDRPRLRARTSPPGSTRASATRPASRAAPAPTPVPTDAITELTLIALNLARMR